MTKYTKYLLVLVTASHTVSSAHQYGLNVFIANKEYASLITKGMGSGLCELVYEYKNAKMLVQKDSRNGLLHLWRYVALSLTFFKPRPAFVTVYKDDFWPPCYHYITNLRYPDKLRHASCSRDHKIR